MDNQEITVLSVQKKLRPKIEDVAPAILAEDKLKSLLNFTQFLRDNKITAGWVTHNSWKATYKGKGFIYIKIIKQDWDVRLERSLFREYEKYIKDNDLKNAILEIVTSPALCGPDRLCGRMKNVTLFGKKFDEVCSCWPFISENPEGEALERLKKTVLGSKKVIDSIIADKDAITYKKDRITDGFVILSNKRISGISGPDTRKASERVKNLFDSKYGTKYCTNNYGDILFSLDKPEKIVMYSLVTANDSKEFGGRLPQKWTLYGEKDGKWVELDKRTKADMPNVENYTEYALEIAKPIECKNFKLTVEGEGHFQFSQMQLYK